MCSSPLRPGSIRGILRFPPDDLRAVRDCFPSVDHIGEMFGSSFRSRPVWASASIDFVDVADRVHAGWEIV